MFDISSNGSTIGVQYRQAPALISRNILKRLRRLGAQLVGSIVKDKLSGDPLERRTSTLSRAIYYKLFLDGQDAVLVIGADIKKAPQARIQEYGGDVVPKRSENLAIPLDAARTARGVARVSAREFMDNPGSLGFDDAFVHRNFKTGSLNILGVRGKTTEAVFTLKKKVTLPERSYLRSTLREKHDWILEELGITAHESASAALLGTDATDTGPVNIGGVE